MDELLSRYKFNGNDNIFAITGDVSLCDEKTIPDTLTLYGVKTLIVDGKLTINCNLVYADTSSSWAIITKNKQTIIDDTVTNLV